MKVKKSNKGKLFVVGACKEMIYLPMRNGGPGEISVLVPGDDSEVDVFTMIGRVQHLENAGYFFYQDVRYGLDSDTTTKLGVFLKELGDQHYETQLKLEKKWAKEVKSEGT